MKSSFAILFVLAMALFGAFAEAYVGSGYGNCGGYANGLYRTGYGNGPASSVCDTCQCVKTVVRPVVEQIPYTCTRRIRAPRFRPGPVFTGPAVGIYTGPGLIESGPGLIESGPGLIESGPGFIEPRPAFIERSTYINGRGYGAGYGSNLMA